MDFDKLHLPTDNRQLTIKTMKQKNIGNKIVIIHIIFTVKQKNFKISNIFNLNPIIIFPHLNKWVVIFFIILMLGFRTFKRNELGDIKLNL